MYAVVMCRDVVVAGVETPLARFMRHVASRYFLGGGRMTLTDSLLGVRHDALSKTSCLLQAQKGSKVLASSGRPVQGS